MAQIAQDLWIRIKTSASPSTIELTGILVIQLFAFWLPSGLLLSLDRLCPSFALRHKLQPRTKQATPTQIGHCTEVVALNQILGMAVKVLELLMSRAVGKGSLYRFDNALPTVKEVLQDCFLCVVGCEIIFYYSHRILHHPTLYRRIHKQHHQFTAPIALVAQYAHPLEYVLSSILPLWLPPQILGCHIVTCCIFWGCATIETVIAHSGFNFFSVLAQKHDLHHEKSRVNFGTLWFLDYLHGTGA